MKHTVVVLTVIFIIVFCSDFTAVYHRAASEDRRSTIFLNRNKAILQNDSEK